MPPAPSSTAIGDAPRASSVPQTLASAIARPTRTSLRSPGPDGPGRCHSARSNPLPLAGAVAAAGAGAARAATGDDAGWEVTMVDHPMGGLGEQHPAPRSLVGVTIVPEGRKL